MDILVSSNPGALDFLHLLGNDTVKTAESHECLEHARQYELTDFDAEILASFGS